MKSANIHLSTLRLNVLKLTTELEKMETKLERAMKEKEELTEETSGLSKRIFLSQELGRTLSQEKVKWEIEISTLENEASLRIGDALLGSLLFAYGPSLHGNERALLIHDLSNILTTKNILYHGYNRSDTESNSKSSTMITTTVGMPLEESLCNVHEMNVFLHSGMPSSSMSLSQKKTNIQKLRSNSSNIHSHSSDDYSMVTAALIVRHVESCSWPLIVDPLNMSFNFLTNYTKHYSHVFQQTTSSGSAPSVIETTTEDVNLDILIKKAMKCGNVVVVYMDRDWSEPLPMCLSRLMHLHPYHIDSNTMQSILREKQSYDNNGNEVENEEEENDEESDDEDEWIDGNADNSILPAHVCLSSSSSSSSSSHSKKKKKKKVYVEVAPTFRLYFIENRPEEQYCCNSNNNHDMSSRSSLPVPPIGLTPIRFDIGRSGLINVLTSINSNVVSEYREKDEMKKYMESRRKVISLSKEMDDIETDILMLLSNSEGDNLTENDESMQILMDCKKKCSDNMNDISQSLVHMKSVEKLLRVKESQNSLLSPMACLLMQTMVVQNNQNNSNTNGGATEDDRTLIISTSRHKNHHSNTSSCLTVLHQYDLKEWFLETFVLSLCQGISLKEECNKSSHNSSSSKSNTSSSSSSLKKKKKSRKSGHNNTKGHTQTGQCDGVLFRDLKFMIKKRKMKEEEEYNMKHNLFPNKQRQNRKYNNNNNDEMLNSSDYRKSIFTKRDPEHHILQILARDGLLNSTISDNTTNNTNQKKKNEEDFTIEEMTEIQCCVNTKDLLLQRVLSVRSISLISLAIFNYMMTSLTYPF